MIIKEQNHHKATLKASYTIIENKFILKQSYYRRMLNFPPSPRLDKLVSRIDLAPLIRKSVTLTTNFAKYSPISSIQSKRLFRTSRNERFKKHCNLIQTNKENIMKLNTASPICQHIIHPNQKGQKYIKSIQPRVTQSSFEPKRRKEVNNCQQLFDSDPVQMEMTSANLQGLLRKNSMKGNRNLLGFNILTLERKFNFSRFELHSLYSVYKTLLFDSRNSLLRFKESLEVMLNMNKVSIRPQILDMVLKEQQGLSFERFVQMYRKIQQVIFQQSIIDYVQALFQGVYDKERIRFEDITRVLKSRITDKEAHDIAAIIYEQLERNFDNNSVKLTEIIELCKCCENFSKKMYRLYTREEKCD